MNHKHYYCKISSFKQVSNKMFISDPTYEYVHKEHLPNSRLMKLNLKIDDILPGLWNVYLSIDSREIDHNAELICLHHTQNIYSEMDKEYNWIKTGDIGVDSDQAGIYDFKYYRRKNNGSKYDNEVWNTINYNITIKPTDYAGSLTHGAVSSSGFGDGFYNVYKILDQDLKIIGIKIIFIDDDNINKYKKLQFY